MGRVDRRTEFEFLNHVGLPQSPPLLILTPLLHWNPLPANSHCAVFHINVRSESIIVHTVGGHCAARMTVVRARRIE
jgi:hypothetical protein